MYIFLIGITTVLLMYPYSPITAILNVNTAHENHFEIYINVFMTLRKQLKLFFEPYI